MGEALDAVDGVLDIGKLDTDDCADLVDLSDLVRFGVNILNKFCGVNRLFGLVDSFVVGDLGVDCYCLNRRLSVYFVD